MADMTPETSRLIQLQAGRYDIRLVWSGLGTDDLVALLKAQALTDLETEEATKRIAKAEIADRTKRDS